MNQYYDNMNLLSFDTNVVSCIASGDHYHVVLEETAFYPEKGGMAKDTGTLNTIRVLDVLQDNERIVHVVDQPILGSVHGEVDYLQRLQKCQVHSAQHILSYYMESKYPLLTSSHHTSGPNADIAFTWQVEESKETTIELPPIDPEKLVEAINKYANAMIRDNRVIQILYPSYKDFQSHQTKTDFREEDEVRVVKLGDEDYNFCGCIHVPSTAYIQMINVSTIEQTKTGLLLHYQAGEPLRLDYQQRIQIMQSTSTALKFNEYDLLAGVEGLLKQKQDLEHQLQVSKLLYLDTLYDNLLAHVDEVVVAQYDTLTTKEGQLLASRLTSQNKVVYLILKMEERCHVIFAAPKTTKHDMRIDYQTFASQHGLKGGGSPLMAQGGGIYKNSYYEEICVIAQERKQHHEQ